jgi:Fe-S-cluster-containing dehydrogenase component
MQEHDEYRWDEIDCYDGKQLRTYVTWEESRKKDDEDQNRRLLRYLYSIVPESKPAKPKPSEPVPEPVFLFSRKGKTDAAAEEGGKEGPKKFFVLSYLQGEVIMPRGVFSEFAALLLKGSVEAFKQTPDLGGGSQQGCWDRPGMLARLITGWTGLPLGFSERRMDRPGKGSIAPQDWTFPLRRIKATESPEDRFMGVTSSLWNQRRSVTLIAGPGGCDLLLVKRKYLQMLVENRENTLLWERTMERFRKDELPGLLAENRLFEDAAVSPNHRGWMDWVADPAIEVYHYVKEPKKETKQKDAKQKDRPEAWLPFVRIVLPEPREKDLLRKSPAGATPPEAVKAVYPSEVSGRLLIITAPVKEDGAIDQARLVQRADALYLILSGVVRITRRLGGGEILLRQHERDGFFGFTRDNAEAVTDVHLVKVPWEHLHRLEAVYPEVGRVVAERLERHRQQVRQREAQLLVGDYLPPEEPPEEVATKLLVATNILRIDMDLCTRCDQCVVACAETHKGVPRFHRSNPNLRFGKWEIARACVHCSDAPCQAACPVGAITFLPGGTVQIHHDRCIGCEQCPPACPFDVIEMYPRADRQDAPSEKKADEDAATKCDRCLTLDYDPACVAACPYGAAQRGDPRDLFPRLRRWVSAIQPEYTTELERRLRRRVPPPAPPPSGGAGS